MNGTRERSYLEAATAGEVQKVRAAAEGTRDETINAAAFSLGTLIPAGLDRQRAYDQLVEAAISTGYPEKDARYHITRALTQGEARPRTIPETNGHALDSVHAPKEESVRESLAAATDSTYLESRGLVNAALLERSGVTLHGDHVAITQSGYTVKRYIDGRTPRYVNDSGSKTLFHFGDTEGAEVVGVAEGIFDALAAAQAGLPTVATLGSFTDKAAAFLRDRRKVVLIRDSDKGGEAFESKARSLLEGRDVESVHMPEGFSDLAEVAEKASDPVGAVSLVLRSARKTGKRLSLVSLSDVEPESHRPLWRGWLYHGMLHDLYGEGGIGKTSLLYSLVATITNGGTFPDGERFQEPGNVILINGAENHLSRSTVPKIIAAGANRDRVKAVTVVTEADESQRGFSIPEDLPELLSEVREYGAVLCIIDPFLAYLAARLDSYKGQAIRQATTPLNQLAEVTDAAVVVVRHPTKGDGGNPMDKAAGSKELSNAIRVGWYAARDPEQEDGAILTCYKNNDDKKPESLLFHLEGDPRLDCGVVKWDGVSQLTAGDVLNQADDTDPSSLIGQAKDVLQEFLSDGESHAAETVKGLVRDKLGCSAKTVSRAARKLGVEAFQHREDGRVSHWRWRLPRAKQEPSAQQTPSDPEPTEEEAEPETPAPKEALFAEPHFGAKAVCARCNFSTTYSYIGEEPVCPDCSQSQPESA